MGKDTWFALNAIQTRNRSKGILCMMVNGNPTVTVTQKAQESIVQIGASGQKAPESISHKREKKDSCI